MSYIRIWCCALLLVIAGSSGAQEPFKISHQPYLQAMTDTSVFIVWTTNKDAIAWVELAPDDSSNFYKVERPEFFSVSGGLKNIGTIHSVHLQGLKPGTRYRYRVYSREVLKRDFVNIYYGAVAATVVWGKEPLAFTTPGKKDEVEFAVVNDIHERNDILGKLLRQVDFGRTDFVFFNGDMINDFSKPDQVFTGFMDRATELFASEVPMYYARGNHETRGVFASAFSRLFPTVSGQLYYMFTRGNACFIVLDGGEDKADSDIEYSGIADMDYYRTEQAKWLQNALNSEVFKKSKYKIAVCHMPPTTGWHGNEDILKKWVPVLNDAGIQVMLTGHEHRHKIIQPSAAIKFPVIINSNNNLIKAYLSDKEARFSMLDTLGKKVEELILR